MIEPITRRGFLGAAVTAAAGMAATDSAPLVDTHIHLFDPQRFPYHPQAVYRPPAQTLEDYVKFAPAAGIRHVVIVHPEPYQDDHRYLEYCFANEPRRGFFKGTCLFDPIAESTPARMAALMKRYPGRIVALRMHATQDPKLPATTSGPIRDRDLAHPAIRTVLRKAQELGLAIQMHFIPHYAPGIARLAGEFRELPVVLDHLGRPGQGTPAEYEEVLKLARYPRVYMKYSSVSSASKQPWPHDDVRPVVKRVWEAFGPERIIWGGLGMNAGEFEKSRTLLDRMFDFARESDRARIRGINAMRLYRFSA